MIMDDISQLDPEDLCLRGPVQLDRKITLGDLQLATHDLENEDILYSLRVDLLQHFQALCRVFHSTAQGNIISSCQGVQGLLFRVITNFGPNYYTRLVYLHLIQIHFK